MRRQLLYKLRYSVSLWLPPGGLLPASTFADKDYMRTRGDATVIGISQSRTVKTISDIHAKSNQPKQFLVMSELVLVPDCLFVETLFCDL